MKRFFSLFLILLSLNALISIAAAQEGELIAAEPNAEAWMPNAVLRTAVRKQLGLAEAEALTKEKMLELTSLRVTRAYNDRSTEITNLSGLEHATNLTALEIDNTVVGIDNRSTLSDLGPLTGLTNLTVLILSSHNLSNLTPLAGLTNLQELYLADNAIVDTSALSGLTNLTMLYLVDNAIVDVSPLSGLTNLTVLELQGNAVEDVSALSGLTNLTWLNLRDNSITDLNPLANLVNLTELRLAGNDIADTDPLGSLTTQIDIDVPGVEFPDANLAAVIRTELGLAPNAIAITTTAMRTLIMIGAWSRDISDLTGLEHAINLGQLAVQDNSIEDITPLAGLTNLDKLWLHGNNISDLTPLIALTNIAELDIRNNNITDVSPLVNLVNLTELSIAGNDIADLSPLIHHPRLRAGVDVVLPSVTPDIGLTAAVRDALGIDSRRRISAYTLQALTTLNAARRNISDLTGLEHATNLTELELYRNEVSDLTPLSGLTSLTTLKLSRNAIVDVGPLSGLTNLLDLHLNDNAVEDVTPLAALTNLMALRLRNNGLEDVTPLAALENLRILWIEGNPLSASTVIPDAGLAKAVQKKLGLLSPQFITEATLQELTTLDAPRRNISDLTGLEHATNLTELELYRNNVSDLTPLANLPNLRSLKLSRNALENYPLAPIRNIKSLEVLHVNDNNINGASILWGLPNLTELRIRGNHVIDADIRTLGNSTPLTILDLDKNPISDLSGLSGLTELRYLGLKDLREIGDDPIDLTPLAALENLETLRLAGTNISRDTRPLYPLTQNNLTDVDIEISQYSPWDVNEDGNVDGSDSWIVIQTIWLGGTNPRADVNGDGVVNWDDAQEVNAHWDAAAAPFLSEDMLSGLDKASIASLDPAFLERQLDLLRAQGEGGLKYERTIALLENLLASLRPEETVLLANYPNPFNPETWLPYQLAQESHVLLIIYDVRGTVVRQLALGHQAAGYYRSQSRAAYWDGRNAIGERVSSGIYFYELRADEVSPLRKMVILK